MRYKAGDFGHFSKAERIMAMQVYLMKLERELRTGQVDFVKRNFVNTEIEDIIEKITRGKSAVGFDVQDFQDMTRRYNTDEAYKQEIDEKIAGTWEDPKKKQKREEKEAKANAESKT